MELRPSLKMGKSICAKSPISYLTTVPPEFETFKLLLKAVALAYLNISFLPESSVANTTVDFVIRTVANRKRIQGLVAHMIATSKTMFVIPS